MNEGSVSQPLQEGTVDALTMYKELRGWIHNEHSLIGNRVEWLVASNSFLFYTFFADKDEKLTCALLWVIPLAGFVLGALFFVLIFTAIKTIERLRGRENLLLQKYEVLQLTHPEFSCDKYFYGFDSLKDKKALERSEWALKDRWRSTHNSAMWATVAIPFLVFLFWLVMFILVLCGCVG